MHRLLRSSEVAAFETDARLPDGDNDCNAAKKSSRPRAVPCGNGDCVVQIAESEPSRAAAHRLVHDRYSRRGYQVADCLQASPHQTTIAVLAGRVLVGTATLQVDSALGVGADLAFKDHIDGYRAKGAKLCEVTRFALAQGVCSETVIAAAFHFLYILAFHQRRCSHVFIEVNPRHRRFYEKYGFECQTAVRMISRVNAPAYLLQVRTDYLASRIFHPSQDVGFPRFYSAADEQAILARLTQAGSLAGAAAAPVADLLPPNS